MTDGLGSNRAVRASDHRLSEVEDLILRCGLRDRAAFHALYEATSAKLFGICLRVLNDRAAAEDALQETYVKIWHVSDRYAAGVAAPLAWLSTIARNTAVDVLRARARRREDGDTVLEVLPDRSATAEQVSIARGEAARIAACIDALEAARGAALRGAYLDGRTYADLAAAADVPINTMRSWLRRALISVRECMAR